MRIQRPFATLAAVVLMMTALAGCSVSVTDGEQKHPTDSSSVSEADADASGADQESDNGTTSDEGDAAFDRGELTAMATTVTRCDSEIVLLDDGVITRVEGDCDWLTLNSTGSQIVADNVTHLEIIGDGNVVLTGEVGDVLVNGEGNVLHWQGATPTITDVGSTNLLKAG